MKKYLLFLTWALICLSPRTHAAILVGPGGSGTITFNTLPVPDEWSTLVNGGGGGDIIDAAGLDAAVGTNSASVITNVLGSTPTTAPAISSASNARWNSAVGAVQTVATSAGYVSLMATLQNDTGIAQSALTFSYDLLENHATGGTNANAVVEEVPGHRVYFSLTGAPGSWQVIPAISSIGASGTLVGNANLGSWANGSLLYLLWADDNAAADRNNTNNEEGGYLIDNVTFKAGTITSVIPVGPNGSGTFSFSSYPNVLEGWFTHLHGGGNPDIVDTAGLDAAVQTNDVVAFTQQLGNSATVAPSISASGLARWNTALNVVQTVATGGAYVSLLAKLRNDSGSDQSILSITYELNELHAAGTTVAEEVAGHRVYFSLLGIAGSWIVIPELSSVGTPGTLTADLFLGSWPPGSLLYVLWADENANATRNDANTEEGGYTIDNLTFSFGSLGAVTLATPTNGQTFPEGVPINLSALVVLPGTVVDVSFYDLSGGGTLIGSDSTAPFSVILSNAALGVHSLLATAMDDVGNGGTSPQVDITVVPNNPPTATLTAPAAGDNFFVGANVTCTATASDSDGSIARIEFYLDGTLLFTDAASPYTFTLGDITATTHALSAVAVDNGGFRGTNTISITGTNPPGITVLVPNGSTWKYLDDGSNQELFWIAPLFDDSGWSNGIAELGYGDAAGNSRPERTVVGFGPDANAKFPTTYFRKTVNIADPFASGGFVLRLLRDDGAIVHLNGIEIFRSGVASPVVDFSSYTPPAAADDGAIYQETNMTPAQLTGILMPGDNTFAVEIHQDAANSSDISFDLMFWGVVPGGPILSIVLNLDGSVTLSWAGGGTLIDTSDPSVPRASWSPVIGATSPYTIPAGSLAPHRFFGVRVP